jgi:hypothetical protein
MPHYYLHLWIGQIFGEDPGGEEYADVSAAHANALALFREMPEGWLGLTPQDRSKLAIEVMDEAVRDAGAQATKASLYPSRSGACGRRGSSL